MINDEFVVQRVFDKLDEVGQDVTKCKIDIQGVKKDLKNHLDNKKSESESFNRRVKIGMGLTGLVFTVYVTLKELL